jgi:hypothetical protein
MTKTHIMKAHKSNVDKHGRVNKTAVASGPRYQFLIFYVKGEVQVQCIWSLSPILKHPSEPDEYSNRMHSPGSKLRPSGTGIEFHTF